MGTKSIRNSVIRKNEFNKELLEKMYRLMLTSRFYEDKANSLYREKIVEEKPLSGIGQEAVSIGAVLPLYKSDYIAPTLRTKGALIAKGMTVKQCFLELLRKEGSLSNGFWTSHHVGDMDNGILLTSAVVSSSLSVAAGVALSAKLRNSGQVIVAFFGDGGSSRADFHTSVNFASVLNLPIVFVCENNLYALSTRIEYQMKNPNIADRAVGYGIPGETVDGQDILSVYSATSRAIDRARRCKGPTILDCKTYRFRGHTESHVPADDRNPEELSYWYNRCPIKILKNYLIENGLFSIEQLKTIEEQAFNEVENDANYAKSAPDVQVDDFSKYVYAE